MKDASVKLLTVTLFIIALYAVIFLPMGETRAHSEGRSVQGESIESNIIDQKILQNLNIQVVIVAAILLLILLCSALISGENSANKTKKIIFWSIVSVIAFSSFFFVGTTLYMNISSMTKGPVHWHADFKIIACEKEIDPVDVGGLSNKKGTNVLHEHEDRRIHIEGVVVKESDVSLESFFAVQGGELTETSFAIPTNEGILRYTNGDQCKDAGAGLWQVFLYKTDNDTARQQKLDDFVHYVPSPYTNVPPGDCIIFEFGPEKERTAALCDFYQLEVNQGNLNIL